MSYLMQAMPLRLITKEMMNQPFSGNQNNFVGISMFSNITLFLKLRTNTFHRDVRTYVSIKIVRDLSRNIH